PPAPASCSVDEFLAFAKRRGTVGAASPAPSSGPVGVAAAAASGPVGSAALLPRSAGCRPGVCLLVSTCNDFVDQQWNVSKRNLGQFMDDVRLLAEEMVLWEYPIAVVGGLARQWNINALYDQLVDVYRMVMKNAGVLVLDGVRFFDSILHHRNPTGWHFRSCDETHNAFARLVQQCVLIATTCVFPTSWWKITWKWDWPEMRHTQDGAEVARGARQVMDDQHDREEGEPRPLRGHECPEHPDPDEATSPSEAERPYAPLADEEVDLVVVEEAERMAAQAASEAALQAQRAAEGEVPPVASGSVGTASTGSFTLVGESVRSTDSYEMVSGTVGIATAPTGEVSGTVGVAGVSWQPRMPPSTSSEGVS
ncbi:MAG: hypothetical protein GY772_18015, partial [bacterium]|nr:hypothetical protein [bacterium]